MKKLSIYTLILLVVGLALVYAQNNMKNTKKTVIKELAEIYDNYGDTFFRSLFSIEQLRPYSILQIDKVIDVYDNNIWQSSNEIVSKLNNNERTTLLIKINEYILNQELKENQEKVIKSIKLWCIAESQFKFILEKLGFSQEDIIISGKKVINSNNNVTEINLNSKDPNIQFYRLLNYISSLDNHRQLEFYSALYHELALLSKEK